MLTPKEFAVLLDGEGTIFSSLNNNSSTVSPVVAVGMTDPTYPKILHEQFGGYLLHRKSEGVNFQRIWHWSVRGKGCEPVLAFVVAELRIKKLQGEAALLMATLMPNKGGKCTVKQHLLRWKLHELIRRLNRTGPSQTEIEEALSEVEESSQS